MQIGFFELEGWEEKIVREKFPNDEIFFFKDEIDVNKLPSETNFDAISIFIDSKINEEILNHFPNLKFIATRSTGYDHIDLEKCKEKGILVSYVPGYGSSTVAEFTFGLILNLTRKIYSSAEYLKHRESFSLSELRGIELRDKTLGVIGVGRIGREVIKIAKAFGMKVIANSPRPDPSLEQELGFGYASLEELLKNSDVITIHCPYNSSTHHLINENNIRLIKKGAYLVNTARGGIIDTKSLVEALQEGIFGGVGLDVLEEEKGITDELEFLSKQETPEEQLKTILYDHALMKMPNVLITPHNAFNSKEALERIVNITIENIQGFINQKPINLAHEN